MASDPLSPTLRPGVIGVMVLSAVLIVAGVLQNEMGVALAAGVALIISSVTLFVLNRRLRKP